MLDACPTTPTDAPIRAARCPGPLSAPNQTAHDAANVAKLLGPNPGRIVLLTSDYHSARALRTFRQAGLNTTALPYPDANKRINVWKDGWTVFLILSDETVKTVWYRVYR